MRLKLACALAAVALAGCGGAEPTKPGASGATRPQTTLPSRGEPAKSPEEAVLRLWRWLQIGGPIIVDAYDDRLVKAVGSGDILSALAPRRPQFAAQPKIFKVEETRQGILVFVRSRLPKQPALISGYLLHLRDGDWLVKYDSNLYDGLVTYVQGKTQRRIDPKAKFPSTRAVDAGQAAGNQFLRLFAPQPLRGRLKTR